MRREAKRARSNVHGLSRVFLAASRLLVFLIGLLAVVMPWSERYSSLDNFPHGQDFELSLFAFLSLLCLVLLLLHLSKLMLEGRFALKQWVSAMSSRRLRLRPGVSDGRIFAVLRIPPLPGLSSDAFSLPLQI